MPLEERDVDMLSAEEMRELLRRQRVHTIVPQDPHTLTSYRGVIQPPKPSNKNMVSNENVHANGVAHTWMTRMKTTCPSC